jgi:hypothetical protein
MLSSASLSNSSSSDESLSSLTRIKAPKLISDEYYPTWKLLLNAYLADRKLLVLLKLQIDSANWKSMCALTDEAELELLLSSVASCGVVKRITSNIPTIKQEIQSLELKSDNDRNSQSSISVPEINKQLISTTEKIRKLYYIYYLKHYQINYRFK